MAKSLRCKREKRLRALRRDLVQPFYDAKDAAKLAAQAAALAAGPLLPLPDPTPANTASDAMDIEMDDEPSFNAQNLKPTGRVGKKKLKMKMKKNKKRGKGNGRKFKI